MSETATVTETAAANPFDPDQFATGGGLWDGKTVTITGAVAKVEALTYGDGKPVIDEKTKAQSIQTALILTGIADGGDDKERKETYSAGDKVVPTPDGFGFVDKETGAAPRFHANSNIAKLGGALKAAGFDLGLLWDAGARKQRFDRLIGARFVFKAEPKVGKDGKVLKDKKGYAKNTFLPVKFVGFAAAAGITAGVPAAAGVSGGGATTGGNGADALKAKAAGAVTVALAKGPLTRADLVRTLAQQLAGDADANPIIGLVVRDDFHKGQAWKYDGVTATL